MKSQKTAAATSNPVVIKLPGDLGTSRSKELFAYVLDGNGKVIETTPFKEGSAELTSSGQTVKGGRLFIGSAFPAEYPASKIDAYAMTQAGAFQVSASFNKNNEILIPRLPSTGIIFPHLEFCEVQGTVTNNLVVNGVTQNGPVCKAKVHICTVDWFFSWPFWLRPVIPPDVLATLKNSIVALRTGPFGPVSPDPAPGLISKLALSRSFQGSRANFSASVPAPAQKALSADIESKILSATPDNIQEIVFNHAEILYPYFCRWPIFWPWFFRVVEQEVVYTDCNGYFDGWLLSFGAPVAENVYIWIEASIGGTWVTVYRPPFPCNTHWDYACGTDINITLNNSAIPPCSCDAPVVDGSVWFTAIGSSAIALNIQQNEGLYYHGIPLAGCTNLFDSNQLCPFGSTLGLYLAFGPTLPAKYYRWSWTYAFDSAMNPITGAPTNVIGGPVERYYLWPLPNGNWESGSLSLLAADSGSNIAYVIPQYVVNSNPGLSGVSPLAEWGAFNFLSAALNSLQINNGYVVRLNLELLNLNTVTGLFEVASVPQDSTFNTFQISNNTGPVYGGSSPATAAYLTPDPAKAGNALAFSMLVRVDNSNVTAAINPATLLTSDGSAIPGSTVNPCGFLEFSDASQELGLSFLAAEPFGRATFGYDIILGTAGLLSTNGYVFADSVACSPASFGSFSQSGATFSDDPSISAMLNGCTSAAYAVQLSVASLATDGSNALSQTVSGFYASQTVAFALTPSTPPESSP